MGGIDPEVALRTPMAIITRDLEYSELQEQVKDLKRIQSENETNSTNGKR